jgi:hypothetical protein
MTGVPHAGVGAGAMVRALLRWRVMTVLAGLPPAAHRARVLQKIGRRRSAAEPLLVGHGPQHRFEYARVDAVRFHHQPDHRIPDGFIDGQILALRH